MGDILPPASGATVSRCFAGDGARYRLAVPTDIPADTPLQSLDGDTLPIEQWTTTFHLALMVLDPYTLESSWIVDTAARVLRTFSEADCRTAFLLTCSTR